MNEPNPTSREAATTDTEDRRHTLREPSSARVRVTLAEQELEGIAENVSRAGVLFFSPEALAVSVEIEEDGVVRTLVGRVARVERMSAENSGYAIEFDAQQA